MDWHTDTPHLSTIFIFFFCFSIEVKLTYNIVLVSGLQYNDLIFVYTMR